MKKRLSVMLILLFMLLLLANPTLGQNAVVKGIFLCGKVIIPSLFPFTVCVLFLVKRGALRQLTPLRIIARLFHLPPEAFGIFLLSAVGGYPIGAKLLQESVSEKRLSKENASLMLCYCVNAGPAFILLTVGSGLFSSVLIGKLLLISHLAASFLLAFSGGFFLKKESAPPPKSDALPFSDCFVLAVAEAAKSVFLICAYVILFSVITAYWRHIFRVFPFWEGLCALLEITCGLSQTRDLFIVSFLLGFAGLSVWCQVFSLAKGIRVRFGRFVLARILHGFSSALFTFLLLRMFPVTLAASARIQTALVFDNIGLSLALLMMAILFSLSFFDRPTLIEKPH